MTGWSIDKTKKSNLAFSATSMKWLRTPKEIWADLTKEFNFTVDCCASDQNHLLPKYYTKENSCLDKDWTGEIAYIHPLFDSKIPKFVEKAYHTKNFTGVFLLPAATHTKYFHDFMYQPKRGFRFGHDDGTEDDPKKFGYIKPLMIVIFRNP